MIRTLEALTEEYENLLGIAEWFVECQELFYHGMFRHHGAVREIQATIAMAYTELRDEVSCYRE